MMMVLWAYVGFIGAIIFSVVAGAAMIGMPVDDVFMIGVRTAAWMVAIPAVVAVTINEFRSRRR